MVTDLEFEARNIEKAVEKASKKTKIEKEALQYKVISYGSTGIFGLVGSKKAKIKVFLPEKDSDATKKMKGSLASDTDTRSLAKEKVDAFISEAGIEENVQPEGILSEEALEAGKKVLQRIIDAITADASIDIAQNSRSVQFNIEGGNAGILIGKRGQTLEAMQYLVEKVINKHNDKRVRVQIDVEGYLATRKNTLENLAARLSKKVRRTGRPVRVGQMNAHDRRIVHLALKNDKDVRTQSLGEGFYRKLMIFPKKKRSARKR